MGSVAWTRGSKEETTGEKPRGLVGAPEASHTSLLTAHGPTFQLAAQGLVCPHTAHGLDVAPKAAAPVPYLLINTSRAKVLQTSWPSHITNHVPLGHHIPNQGAADAGQALAANL